jgi:hypothetical protein
MEYKVLNNKTAQKVLSRKMDRRQFLRLSGFVVLSVIGANKLMTILDKVDESSNSEKASHGFGSSKFGA